MTDKRERFVALAEKRVTRALRDLRLVGNLANKNNYSYTEQDAGKIIGALDAELKVLKSRFASGIDKNSSRFKL